MMQYEWDEAKAAANLFKHGVSFKVASRVFDDPFVQFFVDQVVDGEERWNAIGLASGILLVVVTHVYRSIEEDDQSVIRIISARRASSHERKRYQEGLDS